jgi:type 1 fimbria pilin
MMKQLAAFAATFALQGLALAGVAYASPVSQVLAVQAAPVRLPSAGGTMSVAAKVRGVTECWLVVLTDPANVRVALPAPADCAKGSYEEKVAFGPNRARHPAVVGLEIFASRPNAIAAEGSLNITVAAAPAPAVTPGVLSATTTPRGLPSDGGVVTVIGHVVGGRRCQLAVLANPANVQVTLPTPVNCSSGIVTAPIVFGPNPTTTAAVVKLGLYPAGLASKHAGVIYVELAPR